MVLNKRFVFTITPSDPFSVNIAALDSLQFVYADMDKNVERKL